MDTQYTVGLATNVNITYMSTGTDKPDTFDAFIDQANYLLAMEKPPQAIIMTYPLNENELSLAQHSC